MKTDSVASKFNGLILLSVVISVLIPSIMITAFLLNRLTQEIYEKDLLHSRGLASSVSGFLDLAYALNYQLSINPIIIETVSSAANDWKLRQATYRELNLKGASPGELNGLPFLTAMQETYDLVELFFVQDKNGYQVARSFGPLGYRGERWWFKKIMATAPSYDPFISKSYYSMTGDHPVASAFHPIFKNREFIGIMGTDINFDKLQRLVSHYNTASDLEAMVIDNQGVIIADPDRSRVREMYNLITMTRKELVRDPDGKTLLDSSGYHRTRTIKLDWPSSLSVHIKDLLAGQTKIVKNVSIKGKRYLLHMIPVPLPGNPSSNQHYGLIMRRDYSSIYRSMWSVCLFIFGFTASVILVLIPLFRSRFHRIILFPLRKLTESMRTTAPNPRLDINTNDEFQVLADTYYQLRQNLSCSNEKLNALNQELEQRVWERTEDLARLTAHLTNEIAERKKMEEKLIQAKHEADFANRAKSDFLANMSHEIRTPMNAIFGFTDLVIKTELTAKQMSYMDKIRSSCRSLLGIIQEVLDYSKIEAGKLTLEHIPFHLPAIITEAADMLSAKASEKSVELILAIDESLPSHLLGDPLRIKQILINLLNNAIKFTDQGEVLLKVQSTQKTARLVKLHFAVKDTGIGIEQDKINHLFSPFTQADGSTTRKYGGSGLGLAICHRLVDLMAGKIWVESEPGKGSTFFVEIALKPSGEVEKSTLKLPSHIQGKQVLIVDDNWTSRTVLKRILGDIGLDAVDVPSGEQALDLLQKKQEDHPFSLIFMDWVLPNGQDGLEISRFLKGNQRFASIPIILITAYAQKEQVLEADDIGIEAYLPKPFNKKRIFDTIVGLFKAQAPPPATPSLSKQLTGKRILLVEDSPINQQVANEILAFEGIEVITAENGAEAVQYFKTERFDAILMDLQMPVMDGYHATTAIRNHEAELAVEPEDKTLIVAMTAHAMTDDRDRCLTVGMDDYIAKPIDPDLLISILSKWLLST